MAGTDAQAGRGGVRPATGDTEKMAAMARWINTRMEEINQADARLAQRLEHLKKSEEGLKALFDSLRSQVAGAYPVLEELKKIRPVADEAIKAAVHDARERVATAIDSSKFQTGDFAQQIAADVERQVRENLAGAAEDATKQALASLSGAEEMFSRRTDIIAERMSALERAAESVKGLVNERLRSSIEQVKLDTDSITQPLRDQLVQEAAEEETRLRGMIAKAQNEADQRIAKIEQVMQVATREMDDRLTSSADDFRRRAAESMVSVKQAMSEQLEELDDRARLEVEPILARIEQQRTSGEAQLRAATDAAELALKQRVAELRQTADQVVEQFENRLVQRVLQLKPRASDAMDEASDSLALQMKHLLQKTTELVDLRESEITDRVDRLRPRLMDDLRVLELDLTDQLSKLESQAGSMTKWLEKKLSDRVDDLIKQARSSLRQTLAATVEQHVPVQAPELVVDSTDTKIPSPRVEVEIYLSNQVRTARAA